MDEQEDELICKIPLRQILMVEGLLRMVIGFCLLAYWSDQEHFVRLQYMMGPGRAISVVIHCWLFVPCVLKALYAAVKPIIEGDQVWFDKQGLINRTVVRDLTVAFATFTFGLIYWLVIFDPLSNPRDEHVTVWRCFCATLVTVGLFKSSNKIVESVKEPFMSYRDLYLLGQATLLSLFPMFLTYYDRMPRERLGTEPSILLLFFIYLTGVPLMTMEIYEFATKFPKLTWFDHRWDVLRAERLFTAFFAFMYLAVLIIITSSIYQHKYDHKRDSCDTWGLPAYIRYNNVTKLSPEQLHSCTTKCDEGIEGMSTCVADYQVGCCNRITAIFSYGESYDLQYQFLVFVFVYAIGLGCIDFVTEAVYCSVLSGYTRKSPQHQVEEITGMLNKQQAYEKDKDK